MRALSGPFVLEWDYGIVFAAAIIALVADTVGMILLFECERFWQNDVRVMAVVCAVLTTAVTIMHYVGMLSATWVLVPSSNNNNNLVSGSDYNIDNSSLLAIVLMLALLACAASLGFIIHQFSRRMEMNLGTQQTEIQRLNATIHQLQSALELIKFIRPVFRSDALRFTLFHLLELEKESLANTNKTNNNNNNNSSGGSRIQVSDTTQQHHHIHDVLPQYASDTSSQQVLAAKHSRRGSFVVTTPHNASVINNGMNNNNNSINTNNNTKQTQKNMLTLTTAPLFPLLNNNSNFNNNITATATSNHQSIFSAFLQPTRVEVLEKTTITEERERRSSISDLSNDTIIPGVATTATINSTTTTNAVTPGPRKGRALAAHKRSNSTEIKLYLPRLPSCLEQRAHCGAGGGALGSFDTVMEAITGLNSMAEEELQAVAAKARQEDEDDGTGTYNAIHNNNNNKKHSSNSPVVVLDLVDILQHPVCLELFKDSLCESKSLENIQFWLEVQRFKQLLDTPFHTLSAAAQQTVHLHLATSICNDFIRPHAEFEINISASQRNYVLSKFTPQLHPAQCDRELFAAAEHEVYLLMQNDLYPRFMTTQSYNVCKFLLGRRRTQ
jgi:hypothetical protein